MISVNDRCHHFFVRLCLIVRNHRTHTLQFRSKLVDLLLFTPESLSFGQLDSCFAIARQQLSPGPQTPSLNRLPSSSMPHPSVGLRKKVMLGNYPLLGVDTGFLTGPTPQSFRSCWPGRRCWRRSFPRHVACAPRHARHADHCVELRTASCRPKSRRRSRRRGSSLPTMLLRATPTDSLSPSGPTTARRACLAPNHDFSFVFLRHTSIKAN